MVYTFDSLGYAKRLRENGVAQNQAEAHAEAARDFIMAELATKADVLAVRAEVLAVREELQTVKQELQTVKQDLQQDLQDAKQELQAELRTSIETQSLRLTVRLGAMMIVALGALATLLRLT
jgi:hypothetical protein